MYSRLEFPAIRLILEAGGAGNSIERPLEANFDGLSDSNLAIRFMKQSQQRLGDPAISTANRSWTYRELVEAVKKVAAALTTNPSFIPGSRVVLLLPNSFEYVAAFYGTLLANAVVVPLPPNAESQAIQQVCLSIEAVAVIVPRISKRHHPHFEEIPSQEVTLTGSPQPNSISLRRAQPEGDSELAAVFYTSGSTGSPKGVMLSHRNLIENANSIQQYLEIDASERPLCVLPFYHAFGNSVLQSHILAGAHLILDGQTMFLETLIAAMLRHNVTSFSGVPDLFRLLLERTSLGQTRLPSLRYMAVAGGSLRHDLAVSVANRIAPARFFVMYGQTEATARLAFVPPDCLADLRDDCIGRAVPGVELEVVDELGCRAAAGELGELRARGPNVMLGYWRDVEETSQRLREGWLLTGDLAVTDREGWIYHRGRRNAIIKIAGFRVHPADLEEFAIHRLSALQGIAVPYEVPQIGTRLALFICASPTNELTPAAMLARCRAELPRQLVPNIIRLVDEFPLNSASKIDRAQLAKIAEQQTSQTMTDPLSLKIDVEKSAP